MKNWLKRYSEMAAQATAGAWVVALLPRRRVIRGLGETFTADKPQSRNAAPHEEEKDHRRNSRPSDRHSNADYHSDGGARPEACGRRETVDNPSLLAEDNAPAEKPYARNDSSDQLSTGSGKLQSGKGRHGGRRKPDQSVGSVAGR